jgi:hypothetical protein
MKTIDPGHFYELDSYDGGRQLVLRFMKRIGDGYPHNVGPPYPGTNCQEVIRALIDRVKYLNMQTPHAQNEVILEGLRSALTAFEVRAAERHGRELLIEQPIEHMPSCEVCGHVDCVHLDYGRRFQKTFSLTSGQGK